MSSPSYINVNCNIAIPSGSFPIGIYDLPSLLNVRYTPSTMTGAHHFSIRLENVYLWNTIKPAYIKGEFRQFNAQGEMIKRDFIELNRGYTVQSMVQSGCAYVELVISEWGLEFTEYLNVLRDYVGSGSGNIFLRLHLEREDNTVIEGVLFYVIRVVTGASEYVALSSSQPVTINITRTNSSPYIYMWMFKITEVEGTPSENDYINLKLYEDDVEKYSVTFNLNRISLPYSFTIGAGISFNKVILTPNLSNVNRVKTFFSEFIRFVT